MDIQAAQAERRIVTPLRQIRDVLEMTQKEFADKMGISQSWLSKLEHQREIRDDLKTKMLDIAKEVPDKREAVAEILRRLESWDLKVFELEAQEPQKKVEQVEASAEAFGGFRNAALADRLACVASATGLSAKRVADGLLLGPGRVPQPAERLNDLLYECPVEAGLRAGMVILLGSPAGHPAAAEVLQRFLSRLRASRREVRVDEYRGMPDNFGYPTCMKRLFVRPRTYSPQRYIAPDELATCYEDYGIILSGGPALFRDSNPFGDQARQMIVICGLHRLGTGAGVKLLENKGFRRFVNSINPKAPDFDFPSGDQVGVLSYRVIVQGDNRQWSGEPGFEWRHSRVREFKILESWKEDYARLRRSPISNS